MQMSQDEKYIRFSTGLNYYSLIPQNTDLFERIKNAPKKDYYSSIYRYNSKHLEQYQKTKSVAGITDVTTNRLVFDFDDSKDTNNARKDALEICKRLIESGIDENKIRIFFSGGKGFHVDTVLNTELTRQEFVNIVFGLASDLTTFDEKINDEQRILRVPLTKHQKTGLYKVPLTIAELATKSMEEIAEMAKSIDGFDYADLDDIHYTQDIPEILNDLRTREFKKVTSINDIETPIVVGDFKVTDIDFSKCPKWLAKERYVLQEGFFYGSQSVGQGERNTAFMILAATYKAQGFSADHALGLLVATAEKQAKRTGEEPRTEAQLKLEIINEVYSPAWKGGIYGKDEPLLVATRKRFNIVEDVIEADLVDISNVGFDFKDFAKNIDRNTIKTGLKSLDDSVLITSGMMVSLLAAPGAGKTSFANMFVEHLSQQGENTIYFSLDMYKNLLFSRLLQRYSGYDMRKILDMYKEDDPDNVLKEAYSKVLLNYSNAFFNFRSGPTVEEIEKEIINYQKEKGKDVKLVVVDYLEKVRGPFADTTANSAYVASRLSDIAKKYHTCVLLLVQPQKAAGDPREELLSYRKIKGASVIEQDSRVILTLTRPGYNPKDMSNDTFATISVVKNNMGNLCQLDYRWDGVSGGMYELTYEERKELKALRAEIEAQKNKIIDDI